MDSLPLAPSSLPIRLSGLPGWARTRGRDLAEADAAFMAGIALKSLDDLVQSDPAWAGCWQSRQALKCAGVAVRMAGRNEDEPALRDAVLLTSSGDDPGPAGKLLLAMQKVAGRSATVSTAFIRELAELMALRWDDDLTTAADMADAACQSARAVPFAVTDLVATITALRPDAEALAFVLADCVLAQKLKWPSPVPLLVSERYGPAFRTIGGRGRVRPGEAGFARAICLAMVDATEAALRSAGRLPGAPISFWLSLQKFGPRAPMLSSPGCSMKMLSRHPRRVAICRAGPVRGCLNGLRALAPCANSPAAPRSGFTGCDDDRSEFRKIIRQQRPKTANEWGKRRLA